ncbi:MAG: hypothetical protein EP318_08490 [Rhodobacteraceae bacterium]|nr:MAG: hypothetical protein EP318_08490 [Paracoccaceae bacterium]
MTRYLAVPKNDAVIAALGMTDVSMNPEARKSQVARVKAMRRAYGAQARGADPVTAAVARDATIVGHPEETTSVTGVMVFDLDDKAQVEALRDELTEYEVIEDLPLSLIPPMRSGVQEGAVAALDTWHLEAVLVKAARAAGYKGRGAGVGVAILDTGVEEVDEIKGKIKSAFRLNKDTTLAEEIATMDTDGHGTHVAGLIAGDNVGVAPEAELMNFIMIPKGMGNVSDFIFAIDFVANRPEISIISMSAGIPGYHASMKPSVVLARNMGILPVIAIGNEGANQTRSPGNYTEVLSVGASSRDSKVAAFSGGGTMVPDAMSYTVPDLVAPGKEITSCVMGGGYEAWNGTSMATPIVSGVAALIVERFSTITLADLTDEITGALSLLPGVPEIRQGGGLLQFPRHIWHMGS